MVPQPSRAEAVEKHGPGLVTLRGDNLSPSCVPARPTRLKRRRTCLIREKETFGTKATSTA